MNLEGTRPIKKIENLNYRRAYYISFTEKKERVISEFGSKNSGLGGKKATFWGESATIFPV